MLLSNFEQYLKVVSLRKFQVTITKYISLHTTYLILTFSHINLWSISAEFKTGEKLRGHRTKKLVMNEPKHRRR